MSNTTVITAKELRYNLPKVVEGLRMGRTYTLRYRSVDLGTIVPKVEPRRFEAGSHEAVMESFKHLPSKEDLKDIPDDLNWKKEYGKHLEEKYGQA